MNEAAIRRNSPQATFRILILITALFILLLGYAASYVNVKSVQPQPVPLNPCRTCASGCPCPRMAGTVRCGCPQ